MISTLELSLSLVSLLVVLSLAMLLEAYFNISHIYNQFSLGSNILPGYNNRIPPF